MYGQEALKKLIFLGLSWLKINIMVNSQNDLTLSNAEIN